jgi:hypothetical protein
MKSKCFLSLILVILMIGFISSPALAGGGPEETGDCLILPAPAAGPFIWGTWTVARDQSSCTGICITENEQFAHYNIHIVLRRFGKVHVFSSLSEGEFGDLSLLTEADLLDDTFGWKKLPCQLDVGAAFGIEGTPVIKNLKIRQVENGGSFNETMYGTVLIRVVP